MTTIEMMYLRQIITDMELDVKRKKSDIAREERRIRKLKRILEPNEKKMYDRVREKLSE